MMLTTKGRYAVMSMVELAMNYSKNKPIALYEISLKQGINLGYLEQIFLKLRNKKLVKSIKGPGGGYILNIEPNELNILNIIEAVEETIKITRCNNDEKSRCMSNNTKCLTHDLWEGLAENINDYLRSISLQKICDKTL